MTVTTESPAPGEVTQAGSADPRARRSWHRWSLAVLLAATAVLYLWDLSASQWANAFYSAAAQAGSQSWKAFLFGSSDSANSITVDKPPLSLWPMALSVRVFGLNSWSILVPQALMGVGSVALLWDTVRRRFGEPAGLVSGAVLAITPITVAIFRYNNPDSLLVLLMIAAVWAVLRAVDDGRTRWLVLSGVFVGLGYLTKQLQVALVMPALAAAYLVAGPPRLGKRLWQLLIGLGAAVLAAGWWVALVQLWPADDRPWIGGSQHNSILELTFGYNGLGRLSGDERGSTASLLQSSGVGPKAMVPMWGQPGIGRLFEPAQMGQIVWLLPAALAFLVALLRWGRRAPRCDAERAQVIAWGVWLLCTAGVFSFMAGIFHPYYTVALAPAIAALVGIGVTVCWTLRSGLAARLVLAAAVVVTAATAFHILRHTRWYLPWLPWALAGLGAVVTVALAVGMSGRRGAALGERPAVRAILMAAILVVGLAGPAAYSLTTARHANTGSLPTAGPSLLIRSSVGPVPHAPSARITEASGPPFLLPRGAPGSVAHVPGCSLLDAGTPAPQVLAKLDENASSFRWAAATVGSMCAAGYQLATGYPVMPVGGYNSTDPAPSPDAFMRLALGKHIHYFIITNPVEQDRWGHLNDAALIQQWVQRNYTPIRVARVLMYDLTQ